MHITHQVLCGFAGDEHFTQDWLNPLHPLGYPAVRTGWKNGDNTMDSERIGRENKETPVCFKNAFFGFKDSAASTFALTSAVDSPKKTMRYSDGYTPSTTEMKFWREFREYYNARRGLTTVPVEKRHAVVISRQDSDSRQLLNEAELVEIMKSYGFNVNVVSFDGMKPFEIAATLRKAALVVGAHGAGMANIPFTDSRTVVFEMHNEISQRFGYAHLCKALGNPYFYEIAVEGDSVISEAARMRGLDSDGKPKNFKHYKHFHLKIQPDVFEAKLKDIVELLTESGLY